MRLTIDQAEVAELLGITSRQVLVLVANGQLPEPKFTANGLRLWLRSDITKVVNSEV